MVSRDWCGVKARLEPFHLRDHSARLSKEHGVKLVISTDSHHTKHMDHIRYGVLLARRAWLEKEDVLNTLSAEKFLRALKRRA